MTLITVHKAVAAVVRDNRELLVFKHPIAGVQIPKGTVEPDEGIQAATMRELAEESGLKYTDDPQIIGTWERIVGGGPTEDGPLEINLWHISILQAEGDHPDTWAHRATGSPAEEGLIFEFFWVPIDQGLADKLDPLFSPTAEIIQAHFQNSPSPKSSA
jgi:8-oxo-dGTP pyrophosphatase MutT (NUDIX family)